MVLVYSPIGSYITKTTLAAAATAPDCAGTTVVVTSPQVVTTAIAWPTDRVLRFEPGGYVTFTGAGALTGLKEARPEYFGVNAIPGTTDMTAALMAAYNTHAPIKLYAGTTYLFSTLPIDGWPLVLESDGYETAILKTTAAANIAIPVGGTTSVEGLTLKNIHLLGNTSNLGGIALGVAATYVAWAKLVGVKISGFADGTGADGAGAYGIALNAVQELDVENCKIMGNHVGYYRPDLGYCTSTVIHGGASYIGGNKFGLYLHGLCDDLSISNKVVLEGNEYEAILSDLKPSHIKVDDCYFEYNNLSGQAAVRVTGNGAANQMAKLTFTRNDMHSPDPGNPTSPQLVMDYVIAEIADNSGVHGAGGIVTTANTAAHFRFNRVSDAANMLAVYRALLGTVSALDIDENGRIFEYFSRSGYRDGHLTITQSTAPTAAIQVVQAGAGALATITAGSNDTRGEITIVGGAGASAGSLVEVSFGMAFAAGKPFILLTPTNANASTGIAGATAYAVSIDQSKFVIQINAALVNGASYSWAWQAIE